MMMKLETFGSLQVSAEHTAQETILGNLDSPQITVEIATSSVAQHHRMITKGTFISVETKGYVEKVIEYMDAVTMDVKENWRTLRER